MNEFRELVFLFFQNELFRSIIANAFIASLGVFGYFIKSRNNKDEKGLENSIYALLISAGALFISWSFYAMSFGLDYELLNISTTLSFIIFVACGLIRYYDMKKLLTKQGMLDNFL